MYLKCIFDDKIFLYFREKEREREGQREDVLYIILCLIILILQIKIEGCKLYKDVIYGILFVYRVFKVFFMFGIQ